jgi:sugar transferase EpsL
VTIRASLYRTRLKRLSDVAIVLGLAPLAIPVGLATALLVYWRIGTPVLFRQARAGFSGRSFEIVKFRTMIEANDKNGVLLPDSIRLTVLGRTLRASSLDELPSLWNVLRGDMSLVGPRPLLLDYLPLYSSAQRHRHDVLPGITGWAQVNGRNAISWEQKFKLDCWYVQNFSFGLDLWILLLTAIRVLSKADIAHPGSETMPPFSGNN